MPRRAQRGRTKHTLTQREREALTAQLASLYGWHHHHLLVADRLQDGYPFGFATEVLARGDRAVLVFYTSGSDPTIAQQRWINDLRDVRIVESVVIGPSNARELVRALEHRETRENAA